MKHILMHNRGRKDMKISIIYLKQSRGSVNLSDSSQPTWHSTLSPYILFANFTESPVEQTNGTGIATSHLDYSFGDSIAPSSRKHPSDMLGTAITKSVGRQLLLDQLTGMVAATNKARGIGSTGLLRQMRQGHE